MSGHLKMALTTIRVMRHGHTGAKYLNNADVIRITLDSGSESEMTQHGWQASFRLNSGPRVASSLGMAGIASIEDVIRML